MKMTRIAKIFVGWLVFCAVVFLYQAWDAHVFGQLSPQEHLRQAKMFLNGIPDAGSLEQARRHINALPDKSPEALAANDLLVDIYSKEQVIKQGSPEQQAKVARETAVTDLQMELKNLGYDLTVAGTDTAGEIL